MLKLYILCLTTVFIACGPKPNDITEPILNTYGFDKFNEVEELHFTWNVESPSMQASHSWQWMPKTDTVRYLEKGLISKSLTYQRGKINKNSSEKMKSIDALFKNHQYWLTAPLHFNRDKVSVDLVGDKKMPLSNVRGKHIIVTYPKPHKDILELFLDKKNFLMEWIYRKGGALEPTRVVTWEKHKKVGPIVISFDHKWPAKNFRVWFSKVSIRLKNDKNFTTVKYSPKLKLFH